MTPGPLGGLIGQQPDLEGEVDVVAAVRQPVSVTSDIVIAENVANAIRDFASREKADLIAIATHGRGGLSRMLRGSVADAIMHSGRMSMLVLKPDTVAAREAAPSVEQSGIDLITA